jgi:hypothetical protein
MFFFDNVLSNKDAISFECNMNCGEAMQFFESVGYKPVGRDSSVGIATHYGLDGPGIESRCSDRPWGPRSLLYNGYRFLTGVKRPGRGTDHPPLLASR